MPRQRKQPPKVPAYRQRSGYTQAIVTLTDSETKKRRDYWLGEFDTAESREAYHRVIAEWEARGRRLPPQPDLNGSPAAQAGPVVSELIAEFLRWAETCQHQKHLCGFKTSLAILRRHYGQLPAGDFGPKKLRMVREAMIRQAAATGQSRTWCRKYINSQVQRIRQLFKWGASQELVSVTVYQSLATTEPLRRGRTVARESERVGPVPEELLNAVRPLLSGPVRALVELQLLTGARAG
jgi:hypothetical protein